MNIIVYTNTIKTGEYTGEQITIGFDPRSENFTAYKNDVPLGLFGKSFSALKNDIAAHLDQKPAQEWVRALSIRFKDQQLQWYKSLWVAPFVEDGETVYYESNDSDAGRDRRSRIHGDFSLPLPHASEWRNGLDVGDDTPVYHDFWLPYSAPLLDALIAWADAYYEAGYTIIKTFKDLQSPASELWRQVDVLRNLGEPS